MLADQKAMEDAKKEEKKMKEEEEKKEQCEIYARKRVIARQSTVDNVGSHRQTFRQFNVTGDGWCYYRAFGLADFYPYITDPARLGRLQNHATYLVRRRICGWCDLVVDRGNRSTSESQARLPLYGALNEQGVSDDDLQPIVNLYHDRDRADLYYDQHGVPPASPTTLLDLADKSLAAQIDNLRNDTGHHMWADQLMQQITADAFDTEVLTHTASIANDGIISRDPTTRSLFGER